MALTTIERRPPPFFRQGPSALSRLLLAAALAVFLMAADTRLAITTLIRSTIATGLLPVQQALQVPVRAANDAAAYLRGFHAALAAADAAREQLVKQSVVVATAEQWRAENAQLRALLELKPALPVASIPADVLYQAGDVYSRKVFIDRGAQHGVVHGAPVVNEQGVLGQVTEVYPLSSVVTLLIDRDAVIPVTIVRTRLRGVAHGGAVGGRALELRFLAANADIQVGDTLTTSGVDAVYPSRLLVGRVARVERRSDAGFARVLVAPAAGIEEVRHVLVLQPVGHALPPRPQPAARIPPPRGHAPASAPASGPGDGGAAALPPGAAASAVAIGQMPLLAAAGLAEAAAAAARAASAASSPPAAASAPKQNRRPRPRPQPASAPEAAP